VFNPVQTWKQLRWAFRSYKRLQILRFYCSNTALYTRILHRRFAGAIYRTNFPGRILRRSCYRKFHLVAPGLYTDFRPIGPPVTRRLWLAISHHHGTRCFTGVFLQLARGWLFKESLMLQPTARRVGRSICEVPRPVS